MSAVLALEILYTTVQASMVAEDPAFAAAIRFGWREPPRQLPTFPRIVWRPGDPDGNAGEFLPPRYPGRNPRPLATLGELFTVDLTGWDPTAPLDELAQWRATRLLYDTWQRHVYVAAVGTYAIQRTVWVTEHNEKRVGATLRVVGAIQSMIPDLVRTTAPVDTTADIAVTELDVTEHEAAP